MRRSGFALFAAALASLALAKLLPATAELGLRGTLAVLPVVAALFASAARPLGDRLRGGDIAAAAAWAVLALAHGRLGLEGSGALVVGLAYALAAWRLAHLLPRLARALAAGDAPDRARWPLFALPLAAYLLTWPWASAVRPPDGDEPYYLMLTHSLAEDFDVDLADDYRDRVWERFSPVPLAPQPGDPTGAAGEVYSRHSALLPAALVPFYWLGGARGAQLAMLAAAALLAWAIAAAARRLFPGAPRGALLAWALVAFLPPLLLYAPQLWVEVPAALLVALALGALARLEHWPKAELRHLPALALPLVLLPLLKIRFLAVALPLALLALLRLGRTNRRLQLIVAGSLAAAIAALGIWNHARYGNPFRMHQLAELDLTSVPFARQATGGLGLFFDVAFGLFAVAPLWLVVLPAFGSVLRRVAAPLPELLALTPYLALVAARREWYGGWSPPFRYGLVVLPALALLAVPWLELRWRGGARFLLQALAAASALLALVFLVQPAWAYSLADGGSRWLAELATRYAGDFVRFFPSAIRPRPATWLGIAAALALAIGLARARETRPRAAAPLAVALLFAAWAGLQVATRLLPTRVIEFEDAWVAKRGGMLHPERWTIDRTRHFQGWVLPPGAEVACRPVAGGGSPTLTLRWYYLAHDRPPIALELRAGDRLLASLAPPAAGSWQAVTVGPLDWRPGEELRFLVPVAADHPKARPTAAFILDRATLDWR